MLKSWWLGYRDVDAACR